MPEPPEPLFGRPLKTINIGIPTVADDLESQGVEVVRVDCKPPAAGDLKMLELLDKPGS